MKKLMFGLIATVMLSNLSFANSEIFRKTSFTEVQKNGEEDKLKVYICLYKSWICIHFEKVSLSTSELENLESKGQIIRGQLMVEFSKKLEGTFVLEKDSTIEDGKNVYMIKAGEYSINGNSISLPLSK